ncbi:MAG: DNA adenine methylase [Candidatus Wallbacteria bacterium]|nr:DNA adenine methylase [Candidatus Wallbacteria bacterium]
MSPRPAKPGPGEPPRPEPFLKWAGGKRQLLEQFARFLPSAGSYGAYHEPFLGGGAVFFRLLPRRAILSDTNAELIQCYETIRDDVETVIAALGPCLNDESFYYQMRARDPGSLSRAVRAARTIYLNRTCYNGLYRVNRAGLFNVPFGRYESPVVCNEPALRAAAGALAGVELRVQPFAAVLKATRSEDFVYFDPPYQPLSTTSSFTAYTKEVFGEAEQRELARVFGQLHEAGCRVMLSNSDTPLVRELYAHFRIEQVMANRAINSKSTGRGKIPEVLVLSWRGN